MVLFKRGNLYWSDFSVSGRRYRVPLKTSNKREAGNLEKARIAEAQGSGGLQPSTASRLSFAAAKEPYLSRRATELSASTMKLERYALGQLSKHFDSISIGSLTSGHPAIGLGALLGGS